MPNSIFNEKSDLQSLKQESLEKAFPFEFIQDQVLVSKNGRISVGLECVHQPKSASLSEQGYENLHYAVVQALSGLPTGTVFQKMDIFYEDRFKAEQTGDSFLGRRWLTHFNYRPVIRQKSYIFLSFSNRGQQQDHHAGNTWFALRKPFLKNPLENFERSLKEAEIATSRFLAALSMTQDLGLSRMNNEALENSCYQYLNLNFSENQACCTHSVYQETNACTIGDQQLQIISLSGQGPFSFVCQPDLNGIPSHMLAPLMMDASFPHIVVQSIKVCDTETELRKLDLMRTMLQAFTGARNQEGEVQESGLKELGSEIRTHHKELVKLSVQILVYENDRKLLKQKTDQLLARFLSIAGVKAFVENIDTANLFFACLAGNASENYRWILMPAVNAVCYLNLNSFSERESEGLLVCDRWKQPIYLNFWNPLLDNKNKLVIGPSGSGKSFTVNSFITQHFHEGDDVIIIDVGGSYKGLISILEGHYFEYNPAHPLSFNPFLIDRNQQGKLEPTKEKMNFLISLIAILWKQDGDELTKTERSFLNSYLLEYFDLLSSSPEMNSPKPNMNGFYDFLESKSDCLAAGSFDDKEYFDIRSLLIVFRDFVKDGMYHSLLNAPEELQISDYQLLCFDMNGIREDVVIYPVVSLLIIELVLDKIRRLPVRRKHIYMDEAWSMLKDTLGDFVMNMFRTIRKSNGAITIITQGIDEIEQSSVGKAILQNAATRILLDHSSSPQQLPAIQKTLGLTDHDMVVFKSLRKNDLEGWREFFIKFGSESRVFMLEAPPEARIAFDSRIEQRDELSRMRERYQGNTILAIDQILENKREKR